MNIEKLISEAAIAQINGQGKDAEALYIKAAELGSLLAAHNLGVLYITGAKDLASNKEKSNYWLQISLESGFEHSVASNPEWFKK